MDYVSYLDIYNKYNDKMMSKPQEFFDSIKGCQGLRFYKKSGMIKPIEEWINDMNVYIFEDVRIKITGEDDIGIYKRTNLRVAAFSERQALELMGNELKYFYQFGNGKAINEILDPIKIKGVETPAKISDFDFSTNSKYKYSNEETHGYERFLYEFCKKYGRERGMRPMGKILPELVKYYE